ATPRPPVNLAALTGDRTPFSESPSHERNPDSLKHFRSSSLQLLSPSFKTQMRDYMVDHSERLKKFEEEVYSRREEMQ
uniref:hypothetical protein n=1 Tax=Salmonella enterica TaxID=28901 RepID=UPI0020C1E50A